MSSNAFAATGETELLGGLALDVDLLRRDAQVGGDIGAHGCCVRCNLGRFGDEGAIEVAHFPASGSDQRHCTAQQLTAVGTFPLRVGIGKMTTNITQAGRTKQRIEREAKRKAQAGIKERSAEEVMG